VVIDLAMPVMNGVQAATEIRRLAPDTKIILSSAHDVPASVTAAHRAHHHELEMKTSVVTARVLAASGKPEDGAEAKRRLNKVIADARSGGH
jgi:DNA-binding NarL/FixJ family response regulator